MYTLYHNDNTFPVKSLDGGISEEMTVILAHTDATTEEYIIKDIDFIEFRTKTSGQKLRLTSEDFYLGHEQYHVAGTSERIVVAGPQVQVLANDALVRSQNRIIKLENISNAEDTDSQIQLANNGVLVEGNRIDINTPQGLFVNGNQVATVGGIPVESEITTEETKERKCG